MQGVGFVTLSVAQREGSMWLINSYPVSSFAAQACCTLDEVGSAVANDATVYILRNPLGGRDSILAGKYRFAVEGLPRPVKVQNSPNLKIGVVEGDPRVGKVGIYLVHR